MWPWRGGKREKILLVDRSILPTVTYKFWGEFQGCLFWTSKTKSKVNTATSRWNRQATIQHISCGGVTDARGAVGVIERIQNPKRNFLARPQRSVIQIIDDIMRGQYMTPSHSVAKGNPQGTVVRLRPTLYSPWGLHPTAVTNDSYVLPAAPKKSPTGYVRQHLEGHKLAASWELPISIIDETSRKVFRDWR